MHNFKIKFSLLISVLFLSSGMSAEENRFTEDRFAPVRDKLQTCFVCHGENGVSTQPIFPILAGQEFYYLYVQLKDFKSGLRENPIMGPPCCQYKQRRFAPNGRIFLGNRNGKALILQQHLSRLLPGKK